MITTLTKLTAVKDGDIKKIVNCGKRLLIYNPKKELVYDSVITHTWTTSTPVTNTVIYGTDKEVSAEIIKLDIKPVEIEPIIKPIELDSKIIK